MKKFFAKKCVQLVIAFILGLICAFVFTKTVTSPSESVEHNVPADPVTESRG